MGATSSSRKRREGATERLIDVGFCWLLLASAGFWVCGFWVRVHEVIKINNVELAKTKRRRPS